MAAAKSLEYSIERAAKQYSLLFTMPSYGKILMLNFVVCVVGGVLVVVLPDFSVSGVVLALQFGFLLFLFSTFSDLFVKRVLMRYDPIFTVRRCGSLSLFSVLLWLCFLLIGSFSALFFGSWTFWFDLLLIGFAAVCIFRLVVFSFTSFRPQLIIVLASLIQPVLCLIPMFYVLYSVTYPLGPTLLAYLFLSIPTSILAAFAFTRSVDSVGAESLHTPTTAISRAFLANWMEDLVDPIERVFERFGCEKTISSSILAFARKNRLKSLIVVSSVHPGPFRNVGSSRLPSMIQKALEEKHGCIVSTPHGLYGHEFDLSSQQQNRKVLRNILALNDFSAGSSKASIFVRARKDVVSSSCQIFGDCAILTLTLAPETTEDFPEEVGDAILEEASKLGLAHVLIINAHNSIDGLFDVETALECLKEGALEALREASNLELSPFEVGAAKVVPDEFSFKDGMGPGGICALAVRVNQQICVYVTIDGNNLVSGLREKILGALKDLGVDEGEVLTTDTHVVNAIVMNARGYHPIGEAISHEKLIAYVRCVVKEALENLEPVVSSWQVGDIPKVRVIGEKLIMELPLVADRALRRAKIVAVPLFSSVGLLLMAALFLLQL